MATLKLNPIQAIRKVIKLANTRKVPTHAPRVTNLVWHDNMNATVTWRRMSDGNRFQFNVGLIRSAWPLRTTKDHMELAATLRAHTDEEALKQAGMKRTDVPSETMKEHEPVDLNEVRKAINERAHPALCPSIIAMHWCRMNTALAVHYYYAEKDRRSIATSLIMCDDHHKWNKRNQGGMARWIRTNLRDKHPDSILDLERIERQLRRAASRIDVGWLAVMDRHDNVFALTGTTTGPDGKTRWFEVPTTNFWEQGADLAETIAVAQVRQALIDLWDKAKATGAVEEYVPAGALHAGETFRVTMKGVCEEGTLAERPVIDCAPGSVVTEIKVRVPTALEGLADCMFDHLISDFHVKRGEPGEAAFKITATGMPGYRNAECEGHTIEAAALSALNHIKAAVKFRSKCAEDSLVKLALLIGQIESLDVKAKPS